MSLPISLIPLELAASTSSASLPQDYQDLSYSSADDQHMASPSMTSNNSPYRTQSPASDSMVYMGRRQEMAPYGSDSSLASMSSLASTPGGDRDKTPGFWDYLQSLLPRRKSSRRGNNASDNELETAEARRHRLSLSSPTEPIYMRASSPSRRIPSQEFQARPNCCLNCKSTQSPSWHWTTKGILCDACGLLDELFCDPSQYR
jgi:hypothetical protein